MASVAMPTMPIFNCTVLLDDNTDTNLYDNGSMGMMNSVPSPVYSQSSADSESSNISMSPMSMSMTLSPECLHLQNIVCMGQESVEHLGFPYLRIREEPVEKFRFRYKSEMLGTHGSILGRSSDKNRKKAYPSVELCNYNGPAVVRCSLYTSNPDVGRRTPHTHRLVVRVDNEDKDDPHEIIVSNEVGYIAVFQGMGIIHTAKKHITDELVKKKRARLLENMRTKNINLTSLSMREETNIRHEADQEAKKMNLNSVSLCFEAFMTDSNGFLQPICQAVFSKPINNMKSALTGELKICRIDKHVSSCMGGEEVWVLVEKVGKKNIKIKFFELDDEDHEIWYDYGKFSELDVHHQYAIVFRTPPYRDLDIDKPVDVFLQLYRPTDGDCSEAIKFAYKPSEKLGRSRKRQRSSLIDDVPVGVVQGQRNLNSTMTPIYNPAQNLISSRNDPILTPENDDNVILFERIINENEDNGMDSSEFKEFMNNLSISDLNWIHTRPGVRNFVPENGKPGNIFADTACGGVMYQCHNGIKMEGQTPFDYVETIQNDANMDLTTDGETKRPIKKSTKSQKATSAIDSATLKLGKVSIVENIKQEPLSPAETSSGECDGSELARSVVAKLSEMLQEKPPPHVVAERVKTIFSEQNDLGDRALHSAIINEQKDLLKQMLKVLGRGQYSNIINSRNRQTNTPLHCAVLQNQWEAVRSLLMVGADPNAVNREGDTAIHLAVTHSQDKCLEELLNKSNYLLSSTKLQCNIKNYKGWTPLHLAALNNSLQAVQKLVEFGVDVNEPDSTHGRSVLHMAVEEGNKDITRFLVTQTNIDVNLANYSGNTPLHVACVLGGKGSPELCELLIAHKADPHKANYEYRSLLSEERKYSPDVVEVKEEADSDEEVELHIDIKDDDEYDDDEDDDNTRVSQGQTSFDLASDNKAILELFNKVDKSVEDSKSPQILEVKEEMCMSPISDCTITEDNGLFDEETLHRLCDILDKSKSWANLADLLDYSFLVPSIRNATSPSKLLFNYADLHGNATVQDIRNFLEALDEHLAVEAVDRMLAKQLADIQKH